MLYAVGHLEDTIALVERVGVPEKSCKSSGVV